MYQNYLDKYVLDVPGTANYNLNPGSSTKIQDYGGQKNLKKSVNPQKKPLPSISPKIGQQSRDAVPRLSWYSNYQGFVSDHPGTTSMLYLE